MIRFDVTCEVLEPIEVIDSSGKKVTIEAGLYHLMGLDHLVRLATGGSATTGTDIKLVSAADGKTAYSLTPEQLAHYLADDDVEVSYSGYQPE